MVLLKVDGCPTRIAVDLVNKVRYGKQILLYPAQVVATGLTLNGVSFLNN